MHSPTGPYQPPSWLRRLILLRPGEGRGLAWSTAYFFFVLMSFYLLRPLREAMGIAGGAHRLPWLMSGTLAAMLLANPLSALLLSKLPRQRSVPLIYHFFALNLLALYALFKLLPDLTWLRDGFYIWLSVFNLFVVSLFWALMTELYRVDQGKRLFGVISVGGTAGALVGASLTRLLTSGVSLGAGRSLQVAPATLILLSVVVLEIAVLCMRQASRQSPMGRQRAESADPGPDPMAGLRLLCRSRRLQLIALFVLLHSIVTTWLYFRQGQIVARTFASEVARTAAFAQIDFWVNLLTILTQAFLTSRLFARLGLRGVLSLLPFLVTLSLVALWLWPVYLTIALVMVLSRCLEYAVERPAREVLYIPFGQDERYKAKPFIDTFVSRAGDLAGIWTPGLLALLSLPAGPLWLLLALLWGAVGWQLGGKQGASSPGK